MMSNVSSAPNLTAGVEPHDTKAFWLKIVRRSYAPLAIILARRWQPAALADTSWAPLLLAVGSAGGLARVHGGHQAVGHRDRGVGAVDAQRLGDDIAVRQHVARDADAAKRARAQALLDRLPA